jgi:FAD synthetase
MNILVFGTFDQLHDGHRFLLSGASKRGNVSVIVARDRNVKRVKGKQPRQTEQDRAAAIRGEFPHFNVSIGDPEDFLKPVREIRPDLILLGYDQKLPPGMMEEDLKKYTKHIERFSSYKPKRFKSSNGKSKAIPQKRRGYTL